MCTILAEELGLRRVGIDDNFFELGGHSLLAAKVVNRARGTLGLSLSMSALFEAPTIGALSTRLEAQGAGAGRRVIMLRQGGSLAPLFCLPPVYGLGFAYAGLARELAPDRPIYCFQASGIEPGEPFALSVEEAAAEYARIVRALRPTGPYHLLGWSFGGLLAHAVACHLQEQGETVSALIVLDAFPASAMRAEAPAGGYLPAVRGHLEDAIGTGRHNHIDRLLRLTINNALLTSRFEPRRLTGDMVLVTSRENAGLETAWRPLVSGHVAVHPMACAHMDMMTLDFIGVIARVVQGTLDNSLEAIH